MVVETNNCILGLLKCTGTGMRRTSLTICSHYNILGMVSGIVLKYGFLGVRTTSYYRVGAQLTGQYEQQDVIWMWTVAVTILLFAIALVFKSICLRLPIVEGVAIRTQMAKNLVQNKGQVNPFCRNPFKCAVHVGFVCLLRDRL